MKSFRHAVVRLPAVLAASALALAGCSSGAAVTTLGGTGGTTASSPASATGTPVAGTTFTIRAYAFPAFSATAGQKLTLVDADAEPHTVTADDGSFDSGSFDSAAPGTLIVPTKAGTYAVHCAVHPTMHGTLTVT